MFYNENLGGGNFSKYLSDFFKELSVEEPTKYLMVDKNRYCCQGECGGPGERKVYGEEEDRMLLRLFNDQDTPQPQPQPQSSHTAPQQHHGVKPEAAGGQWQPTNR